MSQWRHYKIGELGKVVTGKTPPSIRPELLTGKIPFITPGDMSEDARNISTERFVSEAWDPKGRLILPEASVCVVCIGMTIGKVCMTSRPSHTNQQINSVIVDAERFDPRFIFYSMRTLAGEIRVRATGAQTRIVNKSVFSDIVVSVPTLEIQHRIASILGAYDDLIEVNRRRIAVLEEMARGLFEEWFVRFRFPGHEAVPLLDTPDGPLPEGWELKTLGEDFSIVLGGTPSRKRDEFWGGAIPWLNSGKANDLRVVEPSERITEQGYSNSSAKMMPERTTIIAITGATLGQVSILTSSMCGNQSLVGIYDKDGRRNEFVYRYVQSRIGEMILHASGGAQQHINKDVVSRFPYRAPKSKLLEYYLKLADPCGSQISNLLRTNQNLAASRDLLLPRLISGQLSVAQAERELEAA